MSSKARFLRWSLPVEFTAQIKKHKGKLILILIATMVSATSFGVVLPILVMWLIDEGVVNKNVNSLVYYTIFAIAVLLINLLFSYFILLIRARLRNAVVQEVSLLMLASFYLMPYGKVLREGTGYFMSRIHDETPRAVEPLLRLVIQVIVLVLSIAASLALIFYLSWRVGLLFALAIPAFYLGCRKFASKIRDTSKQASECEAKAKGILERLVTAHRVVNIFNMNKKSEEKYDSMLAQQMSKLFNNARFSALFGTFGLGFVLGSWYLVLMVSGFETIQGRLTMGGLLAISNVHARLLGYAQSLVDSIPAIQNARATLDRLFEFRHQSRAEALPPASLQAIAARQMGFGYNSEEIWQGLDLKIRKGERVLVIGRNGSGKSTLAHVLAGLLQPTSGGVDSFSLDRVSASFFPPSFIPGDVTENVDFDRLDPEGKELFQEIVEAFEIEGQINEDPAELSAGQRQKVSILRALLKDADFYILDEPFSNIDSNTKDRLFQAILKVTEGKSLMLITHCDEQFFSEFDQVIDLDSAAARVAAGEMQLADTQ